jgi:RNA polymerase sigma-70 factor (ECF subfamily)
MLHAVSGLKHREIAEIYNMPLATVLSKYNRSIKKLQKALEDKLEQQ